MFRIVVYVCLYAFACEYFVYASLYVLRVCDSVLVVCFWVLLVCVCVLGGTEGGYVRLCVLRVVLFDRACVFVFV